MPQLFENPRQLVDEFKKSGEFDRLRRQLLRHFENSDEVRPLMSRVEEIARDKLASDARLEHKTREAVYSEVMQDLERYPIVERAVADLAVFKDEALLASIEQYVGNIMRGESNENTKLWNAQASRSKQGEENDDSSEYSEDDEPGDEDLIITDAEQKESVAGGPKVEQSVNQAPALAMPQDGAGSITFRNTLSPAIQRTAISPGREDITRTLPPAISPSRDGLNVPAIVADHSNDSSTKESLINGAATSSSPKGPEINTHWYGANISHQEAVQATQSSLEGSGTRRDGVASPSSSAVVQASPISHDAPQLETQRAFPPQPTHARISPRSSPKSLTRSPTRSRSPSPLLSSAKPT